MSDFQVAASAPRLGRPRPGRRPAVLRGFEDWDGAVSPRAVLALAERCWRSRGFGDFWPYMLVAEGAADIVCEPAVSLWDLAAPQVIVEEAGGRFTDLGGVRGG